MKKVKKSVNISINKEYKNKLDMKAFALSTQVEERVTTTKVLYTLIDKFLDQVDDEVTKNY
jgi:CRISPR/Cas system CSM-associated protein Csm2 small subunit